MAAYSNYPLHIPTSLIADLQSAADRDGVSMNSFMVQAVLEKLAARRDAGQRTLPSPQEQAAYLEARANRAHPDAMRDILATAGTTHAVLPGDEVPDGWFQDTTSP